jgi:hypothetical protein
MNAKKLTTSAKTGSDSRYTYAVWEQRFLPNTSAATKKRPDAEERTEAFSTRFLQHAHTALTRIQNKK